MAAIALLAPLVLAALFAWAFVEPLHPWAQRWAAGAWALMACEFVVVHGALMANSMSGPQRMRRTTGIGLALFYGAAFFVTWLYTRDTMIVAGAGLLLAHQMVIAWNDDAVTRDARQATTFNAAVGFAVLLVLFMLPLGPPEAGDVNPAGSRRAVEFATTYFLMLAILEARLLLRPRQVQRTEGAESLGAPGMQLRLLADGIDISYQGAWHRVHLWLQVGVLLCATGVLVAMRGRGPAAALLGLFCGLVGLAVVGYCVSAATRRLHLCVRKGEVTCNGRVVPVDAVRNPKVTPTKTLYEGSRGEEQAVHLAYALVLDLGGEKVSLDGFTLREEAEWLGRMFAASLKYGGDERVRAALGTR